MERQSRFSWAGKRVAELGLLPRSSFVITADHLNDLSFSCQPCFSWEVTFILCSGAGCGLCGMLAAALGATALVTDLPSVLQHLKVRQMYVSKLLVWYLRARVHTIPHHTTCLSTQENLDAAYAQSALELAALKSSQAASSSSYAALQSTVIDGSSAALQSTVIDSSGEAASTKQRVAAALNAQSLQAGSIAWGEVRLHFNIYIDIYILLLSPHVVVINAIGLFEGVSSRPL
jgi:hypothetical protein